MASNNNIASSDHQIALAVGRDLQASVTIIVEPKPVIGKDNFLRNILLLLGHPRQVCLPRTKWQDMIR